MRIFQRRQNAIGIFWNSKDTINQVDDAYQELLFILSHLIALVLYYMAIMMTHGANAIKQTICYK